MNRRQGMVRGALLVLPWVGAGCATRTEPVRWYELRTEPPVPTPPRAADRGEVWEVSRRVRLPGALDRDTLQRASGRASLEALTGHRWAAPLRDSVPRLLLHDLRLLRGPGRVWSAPAPPGVAVQRRLQVEVLTLQAAAGKQALRLQASWWLHATTSGADASPPLPRHIDLDVPLADASVDALAAAHRLALWRLAERIAGNAGAPVQPS